MTAVPPESVEQLLTVEEVAAVLRVSRRWVYEAVQRGELPARHFGKYVRVRPVDLAGFIDART